MAHSGMTILLTTHLLEEAEKADHVAILSEGKVVASGNPESLREELGAGLVTVTSGEPAKVESILQDQMGLQPQRVQNQIRIQSDQPGDLVPKLVEHLGGLATTITIGRPSLEDVFIAKTGHRFWAVERD
jgi:ABC-2 type transport system ATP-binding protein